MIKEVKPIYSIKIDPNDWYAAPSKNFFIKQNCKDGALLLDVSSTNAEDSHTHLFYKEVNQLNNKDAYTFQIKPNYSYSLSIRGEVTSGLNTQLVVMYFENEKKISAEYIGLDIEKNLNIPKKTTDIKLLIRLSGNGFVEINEVMLKSYENNLDDLDYNAIKSIDEDKYLILTNVYPEKNNLYRNMFVHRRAEIYENNNLDVDVFRFNTNETSLGYYNFENIFVMTGGKNHLSFLLQNKKYNKILIHFVNQDMIEAIEESKVSIPIIVWIHGVETEKWYRRWFNFSDNSKKLEQALNSIEKNKQVISFMKSLYESESLDVKFVFVSKWFKEAVAENDTNAVVANYEIIHNVIDDELFNYNEKNEKQRLKILSIRPFASRKYANDLTVKAILELSKKPFFNELEFNIYGEGPLFNLTLAPIKHFKNINIYNHFLTQAEISKKHKGHGIFMCPTRLDSQGVSMCEAMSSGLVPITSGVTAIPEFVDKECGFLAKSNNYLDLVNAVEELYNNPELFKKMSYNASNRMRLQCGKQKVIKEELELITS